MSKAGSMAQRLKSWGKDKVSFFGRDVAKRISISVLIGLVSGLGAMAFFFCLEWARWFMLGWATGVHLPAPAGEMLVHLEFETPFRPWLLILVPALGGLLSGILVYTFAPEAEGHGTDAMIDAFHNLRGIIRTRVPFVKSAASVITLATGGSAGREGPIAQIGAGFGSWLSRMLKLPVQERRIFLLAGCAAGLGAIFRAPLGSAITAVEVLYHEDFETEAIIPCVISSVIAYSLFTFGYGFDPIFATPKFVFRDARELIFYAILGVICAPVGWAYVKVFYGTRDAFRRLTKIPKMFRPAIGGLGVGLIALAVPEAMAGGYGYIQMAIFGQMGIGIMLVAAAAKIATTSLTIGSGGSGGVFGPTLFIGGMLGGVVGQLAHMFFPEIVHQPGAYVLVGMAAFFAGAAKAPVGVLLMVSEMTWSYSLLPPLMIVSVIAILFNRGSSIYEKQVRNKFASPAHESDLTVDVLEHRKVSDIFEPDQQITLLKASDSFQDVKRAITVSGQSVFPVIDAEGRLYGILSVKNIRVVLFEDSLQDVVVVGDLCTKPVSLGLDESLYDVLLTFLNTGYGQIPVVEYDQEGRQHILGLLDHNDVTNAYHSEVSRLKARE